MLAKEYRFVESEQKVAGQSTTAVAKADKGKLAGRWTFQEAPEGRTVAYTLVVSADRSYSYHAVVTADGKVTTDAKEEGTFEQTDSHLKFMPNGSKETNVYSYRLRGDELDLQPQGSPKLVTFQRVN